MTIHMSHFLRDDLAQPEPRRIALPRIAPEIVLDLLLNLNRDRRVRISGLPADTTLVSASYEAQWGCFLLRLTSEEFQPIPHGGMAPFLSPSLTDHGPREIPESA